MFLRDAVVNDRIPPITQARRLGGFFAYRFGHAVFDFIEERWGKEGFRDFVYEYRNTLGGRVDRARRARLPASSPRTSTSSSGAGCAGSTCPSWCETGEPSRLRPALPRRRGARAGSSDISPAASPSGDLVAAFTSPSGDVDVVLFDAQQAAADRAT